ncbi:hypothetical protein D3C83_172160 [compost metagenome]
MIHACQVAVAREIGHAVADVDIELSGDLGETDRFTQFSRFGKERHRRRLNHAIYVAGLIEA